MKKLLYILPLCFYMLTTSVCVGCNDENITSASKLPPATSEKEEGDVYKKIMARISEDFTVNPDIVNSLKLYDDTKGCFTDVNYASTSYIGGWEPITHVDRLYDFVFAYTNTANAYYQNEDIYDKIVQGLEYWYACDPYCDNWWLNEIGEPQKLGVLLVQMRFGKKRIPAELEAKTLKRIKDVCRDPAGETGANQTDIALHWIYRSCLEENITDLNYALTNIFEPLKYTSGDEGIQHDNCFRQHGAQLYIGSYGDDLIKGITQAAVYVKGTQFELTSEKLEILSKFMRKTYYQTIRGQYMLFDALGRGVARQGAIKKDATALYAKRMLEIDPVHADEFEAIIARLNGIQPAEYGLKASHTHYYRGDYTLHVRPQYTFDVRTSSTRTMRCEYGNGENLKTYFMSDGCTNIVVKGDEYYNIFPCWNWARIPGITCPKLTSVPLPANAWGVKGTSTFTGGVSDEMNGVSTYMYTDNYEGINTSAKKSWFFFDNEVVCLGAGITSSSSFPVNTTVNQCLNPAGGTIQMSLQKTLSTISSKGEKEYASPDWVLHNGIGYVFPKGGNVFVSSELVKGKWNDINQNSSPAEVQQDVFTVGINHGNTPNKSTYAYIVVPTINSASAMTDYCNNQDIEILSNTETVQVVRNKKFDIIQMVFFEKGSFQNADITVSVDKGCVLMFKNISNQNAHFYIADPAQSQSRIQVKVTIPKLFKGEKTISCDFTGTGVYAGASRIFAL